MNGSLSNQFENPSVLHVYQAHKTAAKPTADDHKHVAHTLAHKHSALGRRNLSEGAEEIRQGRKEMGC